MITESKTVQRLTNGEPMLRNLTSVLGGAFLIASFLCVFGFMTGSLRSQQDEPVIKPKPAAKSPKLPLDTPRKSSNNTTDLQPSSDGEQAVLPVTFIKNRVGNMKIGSSTYVGTNAVKCDARKKVWLYPNSLTGSKSEERPIQLRRDTLGYHLAFENLDHQWDAVELDSQTNYLPVRSLAVK